MKRIVAMLFIAFAGIVHAETDKQFCSTVGYYGSVVVLDAYQGIPKEVEMKRMAGYVCLDGQRCGRRERFIRSVIVTAYEPEVLSNITKVNYDHLAHYLVKISDGTERICRVEIASK